MTSNRVVLVCSLALVAVFSLQAQNDFILGRVLGQDGIIMKSAAPNIVDTRGMASPQGVALDTSGTTTAIYVADSGNNRVLAWRDAAAFTNGAAADLVIGQKDGISTSPNGPKITGSNQTRGLYAPTAVLVDAQGNLYVMDAGNNRILRFPTPFTAQDPFGADQVIGQTDFTTRDNNQGGISASTLSLYTGRGALHGTMAFDAAKNLWVTDGRNHRVLRFPADTANPGSVKKQADLVLGQKDFETASATNRVDVYDKFNTPAGLAIDSAGDVYVTDAAHRVLVFAPPFTNGLAAKYFAGGKISGSGGVVKPPTNASLNSPEGVTVYSDGGQEKVLVSDTSNNRIAVYPPLSSWTAGTAPTSSDWYGQADQSGSQAGVSATGLQAPVQVVADPATGDLFVADALNNRVVVFPRGSKTATRVLGQLGFGHNGPNLIEGKELYLYDLLQTSSGSVALPGGGMAIYAPTSGTPHIYIADTWNHRVLGYCDARKAKQGEKADLVIGQPDLLSSWANGDGGTTPNNKYLRFPTDVAVDSTGNLYVADLGNGRVLRFAAPCEQPAGQQSFPAANLVLGKPNFVTPNTDPSPGQIQMTAPYGLTFTSSGRLLVSDYTHNRILRFSRAGADFTNGQRAEFVFGQPDFVSNGSGSDANQFNGVRHISIDDHNRLFAADYNNDRVLIFSNADETAAQPAAVQAITRTTGANKALTKPVGVYANRQTGEFFIASNSATSVFRWEGFLELPAKPYATTVATSTNPVSVTGDANGTLYVAESGNRVAEYFPGAPTLNAGSYRLDQALAPGSLVSAWIPKTRAVATTHASTVPLPRSLAGLQVIVGGTAAPMLFAGEVSATQVQINFQIPIRTPGSGYTDLQVLDETTGQVYAAWFLPMGRTDPAFFTTNAQGAGQVAALNVDSQGVRSCNGPVGPPSVGCPGGSRPVKPGETLELFLTGPGYQSKASWPKDGEAVANGATDATTDGDLPLVFLNSAYVPAGAVKYSGAAPGFPGVWQVNVVVPNENVNPDGKTGNPILVTYRDISSQPRVSVLVQQK